MSFDVPRIVIPLPPEKPENPENKDLVLRTIFGCDYLNNKIPVDYYWYSIDEPVGLSDVDFEIKKAQFQAAASGRPTRLTPLTIPTEKPKLEEPKPEE